MAGFEYTVTSNKSFDEAVSALEKKAAENSFRVLHFTMSLPLLERKDFSEILSK